MFYLLPYATNLIGDIINGKKASQYSTIRVSAFENCAQFTLKLSSEHFEMMVFLHYSVKLYELTCDI